MYINLSCNVLFLIIPAFYLSLLCLFNFNNAFNVKKIHIFNFYCTCIKLSVWLRNWLIYAGLKPVLIHTSFISPGLQPFKANDNFFKSCNFSFKYQRKAAMYNYKNKTSFLAPRCRRHGLKKQVLILWLYIFIFEENFI